MIELEDLIIHTDFIQSKKTKTKNLMVSFFVQKVFRFASQISLLL